jgi:general secretion pathway protein H
MRHASVDRREHGFTLIELIVVLVILGLAMGLVLTQGPARSPTAEFDSVVRQVTEALRLARSRAIADDRTVAVQFAPRGFRVDQETAIALGPDISLSGSRLIEFTPDGGSSGGEVTLRMGDRRAAIGVDWLTGRVTLSERG